MTDLIYRGVPHEGLSIGQKRVAMDMIYRGVRHDGLSTTTAPAGRGIAMVYRGVRYGYVGEEIREDIAGAAVAAIA